MLKKKIKKFFAFAMALVMTMSVMLSCMSVSAFAVSQSEIDALKSQKSQLSSQKSSLQSTINSLQSQQSDQIALKNALDEKNAITVKQILNLNEQIDLHTELIEQKTAEVEEAQKVADAQLEKYKVRVRAMEESGRYNYFEVLFGASSIGEFLSLIDDIGDIMKSDKELEDAYRQSVDDLKAVKAEYEQAKAEMEDSKAELETLKAQQEKDIAQANAVIASLQGDISSNSSLLSELSAQEKALNADIQAKIAELNADGDIHGFLVQLPLPPHIDEEAVIASISPEKDVDCFHPSNVGRMLIGDPDFLPATPAGVQQMIVRSGIDTSGKHVVVVGRSNIVGKPMAAMMVQKGAGADSTVTVVHSRTRNLAEITSTADILIVAIGKPRFVTADMVKEGAVVIDVGTNRVDDPTHPKGSRLVGDVDFDAVKEKASYITPVPGGVGPMTICMLMANAVRAAEKVVG